MLEEHSDCLALARQRELHAMQITLTRDDLSHLKDSGHAQGVICPAMCGNCSRGVVSNLPLLSRYHASSNFFGVEARGQSVHDVAPRFLCGGFLHPRGGEKSPAAGLLTLM